MMYCSILNASDENNMSTLTDHLLRGKSYESYIINSGYSSNYSWNEKIIDLFKMRDNYDVSRSSGGILINGRLRQLKIPGLTGNMGLLNIIPATVLFWGYKTILDKLYESYVETQPKKVALPHQGDAGIAQREAAIKVPREVSILNWAPIKHTVTVIGAAFLSYYSSAYPAMLFKFSPEAKARQRLSFFQAMIRTIQNLKK